MNSSNIEMNGSNMNMDIANAPVGDGNTSNIIIMTPEMCVVKCLTEEKNNLQNTISQQSNEIGLLIQEKEMWKGKYVEVIGSII